MVLVDHNLVEVDFGKNFLEVGLVNTLANWIKGIESQTLDLDPSFDFSQEAWQVDMHQTYEEWDSHCSNKILGDCSNADYKCLSAERMITLFG